MAGARLSGLDGAVLMRTAAPIFYLTMRGQLTVYGYSHHTSQGTPSEVEANNCNGWVQGPRSVRPVHISTRR